MLVKSSEVVGDNPDGYVYVYGVRGKEKSLIVARVLPENMEDFSQWRFWDGKTWNQDIQQTAGSVYGVSNEFSVSPLPEGRYALVFQEYAMSAFVGLRFGLRPEGGSEARRVGKEWGGW